MKVEIRKAQVGDEKSLAQLQVLSWKAAYQDLLLTSDLQKYLDVSYVESIYKKILDNNKGVGFIMRVGDKDHCLAFWDKARNVEHNEFVELICIHSLPDKWRQGFGTKMLKYVISDCIECGYSHIILWVLAENERAKHFYESLGFYKTTMSKVGIMGIEECYEMVI